MQNLFHKDKLSILKISIRVCTMCRFEVLLLSRILKNRKSLKHKVCSEKKQFIYILIVPIPQLKHVETLFFIVLIFHSINNTHNFPLWLDQALNYCKGNFWKG